jgi:hypothetical protein
MNVQRSGRKGNERVVRVSMKSKKKEREGKEKERNERVQCNAMYECVCVFVLAQFLSSVCLLASIEMYR